jgi:hypothetical protein
MKKIQHKKSMTLGDLTMYLEDLLRMGFVSESMGDDGKLRYKLTELGIKSGLQELPSVRTKIR